jgi:hypothetical protein
MRKFPFSIEMPRSRCIGGFYWLQVPAWHECVVANCIDATTADRPKRMRVQNGCHQGEVVMPHEYILVAREDGLKQIFNRVHT